MRNDKKRSFKDSKQKRKPSFKKEIVKKDRKPTEEAVEDNFVFGNHATIEAIQQGRGNKLFLQEDSKGEKVEQLKILAKEHAVPVKWVPKQKLDTLRFVVVI